LAELPSFTSSTISLETVTAIERQNQESTRRLPRRSRFSIPILNATECKHPVWRFCRCIPAQNPLNLGLLYNRFGVLIFWSG